MSPVRSLLASGLAALAVLAGPAQSQAPRKFTWFEQTVDLGFKIDLHLHGRLVQFDRRADAILDVYLETLADTGDLDEAVDKAFAGVDWAAFESSWKAYVQ